MKAAFGLRADFLLPDFFAAAFLAGMCFPRLAGFGPRQLGQSDRFLRTTECPCCGSGRLTPHGTPASVPLRTAASPASIGHRPAVEAGMAMMETDPRCSAVPPLEVGRRVSTPSHFRCSAVPGLFAQGSEARANRAFSQKRLQSQPVVVGFPENP